MARMLRCSSFAILTYYRVRSGRELLRREPGSRGPAQRGCDEASRRSRPTRAGCAL